MAVLTGIEGMYNCQTNTYDPPKDYNNWRDLVLKKQIEIQVRDNLLVLPVASEGISENRILENYQKSKNAK